MVGLATVFGAGGGTSSYEEAEHADVIVMWGSNARNAHPIFFHHVLAAVRRGARLFVVDPRRSETAQFADRLALLAASERGVEVDHRHGEGERQCDQIPGHRITYQPEFLRHFTCHFEPIE